MVTKREVIEKFKEDAMCEDIYCGECPFNMGVDVRCDVGRRLIKLGAETLLENGDLEEEK